MATAESITVNPEALAKLGEREVWAVDELPGGVNVDALRMLDVDKLVEARAVFMANVGRVNGVAQPWDPQPGAWYSPIRANGWDVVLGRTARDEQNHPAEIRVSERGRAMLSRMRGGIGHGS